MLAGLQVERHLGVTLKRSSSGWLLLGSTCHCHCCVLGLGEVWFGECNVKLSSLTLYYFFSFFLWFWFILKKRKIIDFPLFRILQGRGPVFFLLEARKLNFNRPAVARAVI